MQIDALIQHNLDYQHRYIHGAFFILPVNLLYYLLRISAFNVITLGLLFILILFKSLRIIPLDLALSINEELLFLISLQPSHSRADTHLSLLVLASLALLENLTCIKLLLPESS